MVNNVLDAGKVTVIIGNGLGYGSSSTRTLLASLATSSNAARHKPQGLIKRQRITPHAGS